MGCVSVGPGDVYASVRGDVDFYSGRFAAGVEWDGHGETVVSLQPETRLMITHRW